MADSTIKVRFVGITTDLKRATESVQSSLSGLTDKFSSLGVAGAASAGLIAGAAVQALVTASKAAEDDARSQFTLAKAIANNTDETVAGVEAAEGYISALQNSASVADDELRPALATLVRSTNDLASAQALLGLSSDVAAGTGRDLGSVADALAKAYQGNTRSLKQLAPEVSALIRDGASAGEVFQKLQETYAGSAEGLADVSPWQKLNTQIGEAQEKIGVALLPTIEQFSDSMEDIGPALEDLGPTIKVAAEYFAAMAKPLEVAASAVGKLSSGAGWLADKVGIAGDDSGELAAKFAVLKVESDKTTDSFVGMGQTTSSVDDTLKSAADTARDTANRLRDLKSATFELSDAQQSVADGWDSIDDAAKQSGGSTRDAEQDMRSIRDAAEDLEAAQQDLIEAETKLAEVRSGPAAKSLRDAEIGLRESRNDAAQAAFKVAEAELKIAEIRKEIKDLGNTSPDHSKKSEKEIELSRKLFGAELDLEDARIDQRKSVNDVDDAEKNLNDTKQYGKEGSQSLKDAEDGVAQAKLGVRDATESLEDAQKSATETGGAHEDKTKAIAAAYETQKKNIWATVEAMIEQGKKQPEIDAFIATSGMKLDEYAKKYQLAKGDVDEFRKSLEMLAIMSDDARLGAATAGNYVPPVWTQQGLTGGSTSTANATEHRLTARVAVPLIVNGKSLAEAILEIDGRYN